MLSPAQDSQVQYAMEDTTVDGTAVNASAGLGGRQIIGKTGTTSNYLSGFFIGAIPQYSLVVGMFVNQQDSSDSSADNLSGPWRRRVRRLLAREHLEHLRPGGVREPDAAELPPARSSAAQLWNQIGPLPKAKRRRRPPPSAR